MRQNSEAGRDSFTASTVPSVTEATASVSKDQVLAAEERGENEKLFDRLFLVRASICLQSLHMILGQFTFFRIRDALTAANYGSAGLARRARMAP